MAGIMTPLHAQPSGTQEQQLAALAGKDTITNLVTDSGLGGLSVCAAIDSLARATGRFGDVHLIFANALPDAGSGYNKMKSMERKVQVFDDALRGMTARFHPDLVLIACNTLSVVYPLTPFSRETHIPVIGIVSMGVDMLQEELERHPDRSAIVFGTETTIGAETHKRMLIERGIAPDRIVNQACPNLAGQIERDARGEAVRAAIRGFAVEAAGNRKHPDRGVVAALCCTHYGYCTEFFREALAGLTPAGITIIDPNMRMSQLLFPPADSTARRHATVRCTVRVVSRAEITEEEIRSISGLLAPVSLPAAAALRSYEFQTDLFPYTAE